MTGSGGENIDEAGITVEETGVAEAGGPDETGPIADAHETPRPEAEAGEMPRPSAADASDSAVDASDAPVDLGPRILFSFDSDADFASCDENFIVPPCWLIAGGEDAGGGGTFTPIGDEALPGHVPARALRWTANYGGFGTRISLLATFASNENWTSRTRLHFSIKVVSGFSSLLSFDLFVQGGVEANYAAIYQFNLPDNLVSEGGNGFVNLAIDFNNPSVDRHALAAVAGLGIALRAIADPLAGEAMPAPTVIEVDDIWLE